MINGCYYGCYSQNLKRLKIKDSKRTILKGLFLIANDKKLQSKFC